MAAKPPIVERINQVTQPVTEMGDRLPAHSLDIRLNHPDQLSLAIRPRVVGKMSTAAARKKKTVS